MKQYEKMGFDTEAALKWVEGCKTRLCKDCSARDHRPGRPAFCAVSYLLSDAPKPPKVPRWKTARTQEDFEKLYQHFKLNYCDKFGPEHCNGCKYQNCGSLSCLYPYLSELVDAPEGMGES